MSYQEREKEQQYFDAVPSTEEQTPNQTMTTAEENAAELAMQQNGENAVSESIAQATPLTEKNVAELATQQNEESQPSESADILPSLNQTRSERRGFATRMGDADYVTGRRYDVIKNAFLSYKPQNKKIKALKSRISSGGETFLSGRKLLAKLCLVGGYLRLYFALDPKAYNQQKYHHKDLSEVVRYAKTPLMIKISSDRQKKYAVELIDEVMRLNGFEPNPDYIPVDRADVFRLPPSKRKVKIKTQIIYIDRKNSTQVAAADAVVSPKTANPLDADIKLPKRAKVTNRDGEEIGKVRSSVWFDEQKTELGVFRKEDSNVYFYKNGTKAAFLDGNDNVISMSNDYMASLRRFRTAPFVAVLLVILALVTALSVLLGLYFTKPTTSPNYAPTLFVADESGVEWSQSKELPVFVNEVFGDNIIMPGMNGAYRFTFENKNRDALIFSLVFATTKNDFGLEIVYRLKRDGAYIAGSEGYVTPEQLSSSEMTIEAGSATVFELEWLWRDNDVIDTVAGQNQAQYTLSIDLTAAVLQ